jgi:cytochrome c oxidase subunit 4
MATDTSVADVPGTAPLAHEEVHLSDIHYVRVAVFLAVLTGIEVALSYINGLNGLALLVPLLVIMAIKFGTVALYFMHLKWDSKILTRLFYAGVLLAAGVYVIALSTFRLFAGN